ncbi:G-type lectin S-receptor-like serine/threonine-protein kinase At5g24080 [Zingiber officinale]|uniref:Receptor-like serine/threonine-protein kinase n=1 Tax=Zingiber officinale TaxID=94328 RepID=A0A8J5KFY0_ZINOF|nr:G-type lectin S-receptor-like serine/threonine-protein kinase At5g24080 [Zingiber officinale]KAG6482626.1 hypothetical protein ZIOFF_059259 [Zingiber officinale]
MASLFSSLALLFFLFLSGVCCLEYRIPVGSELSAGGNESWVSENEIFAFGFAQDSASVREQFLLAIWYYGLPDHPTIVWSPNRGFPARRDAVVRLENSGELVLRDGNAVLWTSNTSQLNPSFGVMSDSGDFVLCAAAAGGGNATGRTAAAVWHSFSYPSDTLLPGQQLTVDLALTSATSSSGHYALQMLQQRTSLSLALAYVSPTSNSNYSYWSSPQISNATGEVVAVLDSSGNFGVSYGASSAGTMYIHKNDTQSTFLRRITLGNDGNLRLYRLEANKNWSVEWTAVSNPCTAAGICGSGICNLDSSNNTFSCTPLKPVNCSGRNGGQIKMQTMPQTNYYFPGKSTISNYSGDVNGTECSRHCSDNCECVAAVYGPSPENAKSWCWTLRWVDFGGMQDPSTTLYVKVLAGNESATGESSSGSPSASVLLPLLICFGALVALLSALLFYSARRKRKQKAMRRCVSLPGAPACFSYHELQIATSNFSQLIGTGGFGSVYKGTLRDGTMVAVKKLDKLLPQGEREFIAEVTTIGSMHHMNLVSLCGFCSEQSHRLLVYEYMSRGSLDKWIFRSGEDRVLDWRTRFNIATAIAQGIAYFHEQCRNRIIHCDIKPENILLDEDFCPKVSDFGLAKLMSRQHSQVVTMVRGTRGYLAPEWVSNRPVTVKVDVYSYGMLLLEIVGGRRNLDSSLDEKEFFYPAWAFKEMVNGTASNAVDRRLKRNVEEEEAVRALHVAFWCIQEEAVVRPSMGEVVRMLEGSVSINEPPMPQAVQEFQEEGLHSVYRTMKGRYFFDLPSSSSAMASYRSSKATCSHSTMSPR